MTLKRYFPGKTTIDRLHLLVCFMVVLLIYTCHMVMQRITAEDALKHEWFHEVPLPKSKDFMPTFPAQHAQDRYFELMI